MMTSSYLKGNASQKLAMVVAATLAMVAPMRLTAQANVDTASSATPAASSVVHLTLSSAIEMALRHNRRLSLAQDVVRESEQQKRIAESHFYPVLTNQSAILHVTRLEGVTIPAGSFGASGSSSVVPPADITIDQGGATSYTSGTGLAQPITQLFKIRAGVKSADADLQTAKIHANDAENEIALQVHQLYYNILIEQTHRTAAQAAVEAATITEQETTRGVAEGRLLADAELSSRTDLLDKEQVTLVSRLNLDDLNLRLADLIGLPLGTKLDLDIDSSGSSPTLLPRIEAMTLAMNQSPSVLSARQNVEKARAGVSAARSAYIPDLSGIARYSYQSGLPFLAHNFGTFGGTLSYEVFNGGAREAELRSARIKLSMAQTELEQSENDIRIEIAAAYDKVEQLQELLDVTVHASDARQESLRIQGMRAEADAELASGVAGARAALALSQMNVLNARLNLFLAQDTIKRLLGERPE
jgi:outer membrane protein TolC